jgi:hypothetical protein
MVSISLLLEDQTLSPFVTSASLMMRRRVNPMGLLSQNDGSSLGFELDEWFKLASFRNCNFCTSIAYLQRGVRIKASATTARRCPYEH